VLITLRQMPLTAEGVYRFLVSVGAETSVPLEIPVSIVCRHRYAEIH
jgi:hypothetical protein